MIEMEISRLQAKNTLILNKKKQVQAQMDKEMEDLRKKSEKAISDVDAQWHKNDGALMCLKNLLGEIRKRAVDPHLIASQKEGQALKGTSQCSTFPPPSTSQSSASTAPSSASTAPSNSDSWTLPPPSHSVVVNPPTTKPVWSKNPTTPSYNRSRPASSAPVTNTSTAALEAERAALASMRAAQASKTAKTKTTGLKTYPMSRAKPTSAVTSPCISIDDSDEFDSETDDIIAGVDTSKSSLIVTKPPGL